VDCTLGDTRLTGTVDGIGPNGRVAWRVGSRRGRHLLGAWIRHLALQLVARTDDERWTLWIDRKGSVRLRPVDEPERHLGALVTLYRRGHQGLLPLFPEAAWEFACAEEKGKDGRGRARDEWLGTDWGQPGEAVDPWNRLAWRSVVPLDEQFAALARAVFQPLLAHRAETSA
jgi:exodeoxyribonuclease V gamma subunit